MTNVGEGEIYKQDVQPDPLPGFSYGEFVSIKDHLGDVHKCYCIDADTTKLICSLRKEKPSGIWSVTLAGNTEVPPRVYARRGFLSVYEIEHGFLVCRTLRSNGRVTSFMLAHQLTDTPVVFPSLAFGQAAAELCIPQPNANLGYLWWTYPGISSW